MIKTMPVDHILSLRDPKGLRHLKWDMYEDRYLIPEELAHIYTLLGAFWRFDASDPSKPHALLQSGKHSSGYINSRYPLSFGNIMRLMAWQIRLKCEELGIRKNEIDVVATASYGGNGIGSHLAEFLEARHVYTEKEGKDVQKVGSLIILPGERVLGMEELVTKGTSGGRMVRAFRTENPHQNYEWIQRFLALVLRSDAKEIEGLPLAPVVEFGMDDWTPEECPLCKMGSLAIPPKADDNWDRYFSPWSQAA